MHIGVFGVQHFTQTPAFTGIDKHREFAESRMMAQVLAISFWITTHDFFGKNVSTKRTGFHLTRQKITSLTMFQSKGLTIRPDCAFAQRRSSQIMVFFKRLTLREKAAPGKY
jgi:hypothetical protein